MDTNLDLGSLLSEAGRVAGVFGDASDQISQQVQVGSQAIEAKQRLAQGAADANDIKVRADLAEKGRQEASRQAIAARMNMDPSQPGSVIMKAAKDREEADAGLAEASAAIRDKNSINPLLNPLGWVAAKLTVNDDIQNYNFYARQKNRAEQTAAEATREFDDATKISDGLSSTITESYIGASQVLGAYNYNVAATEAAAQGARWNMEGIMHSAQMDRDRLSVMFSANTAIMQEKQYNVELKRLQISVADQALRTQEFALRQKEFGMREDVYNDKKNEESTILKYIGDGFFNMTGKQMDPVTKTQALVLFKSKNPDIMSMFESGLASAKVTGGDGSKPVISLSPFKASDLVGTGKVTNMSPAMGQVGDQLITWRRAFENPAVQNQYPFDPKDRNSREIAFNKFVAERQQQLLQNTPQDSIYAPAPLEKVAQVNKNIQALPVWQKALAPAAKTGADINDPNIAFGVTIAAMRNGDISYADASDLSLVYAAGLHLNNQARNFLAFGLPAAKSYNTQINVPGTVGKTNINLADRMTYITALNRAEAVNAQYRMTGQGNIPKATVYNKPDMNVTSDINNFPLQAGPAITYPGNEEDRLRKIRTGQ